MSSEADAELDMLDAVCVLNAGGSVDFLDETKTVEEAFQDEAAATTSSRSRGYAVVREVTGRTSSAKIAHLGNTEGSSRYCEQLEGGPEGDEDEQIGHAGSVRERDYVAGDPGRYFDDRCLRENLGTRAADAGRFDEDAADHLAPARAVRDASPEPPSEADPLLSRARVKSRVGLRREFILGGGGAVPGPRAGVAGWGGVADRRRVLRRCCRLFARARVENKGARRRRKCRGSTTGVRVAGAAGCLATLAAPALLAAARQEGYCRATRSPRPPAAAGSQPRGS